MLLSEIGGKISEICRKSEASTPPNFGEMAKIGILNFGEMAKIAVLNFGEMEFFSVNTLKTEKLAIPLQKL